MQIKLKNPNCNYCPSLKADGKPFIFYMHKVGSITGGIGPMGSIPSKLISISVPRSKKAHRLQYIAQIIKSLFLMISILFMILFMQKLSFTVLAFSMILILTTGGLFIKIMYRLTRVSPLFRTNRKLQEIKNLKNQGYKPGFHPAISTTPFGLIYHLFRLIL